MTPEQAAATVAESKRRAAVHAQRIRNVAAARLHAPGYLPSTERDERLWGDRRDCRTCGANLRRTESQFRECSRCEASPAPLEAIPSVPVSFGCGCSPRLP